MDHTGDFYGMLVFRTQSFKVWKHYDQMKHISPLHDLGASLWTDTMIYKENL